LPPPAALHPLQPNRVRGAARRAAAAPANRAQWERVDFGNSGGYLRLSQTTGNTQWDIRAVCGAHPGCTLTRGCKGGQATGASAAKGRPIGLLTAFLQASGDYATKAEHRDSVGTWGSHSKRIEARRSFCSHPGAAAFLAKERATRDDEAPGSEPVGLA
jgi:hypothetical protein